MSKSDVEDYLSHLQTLPPSLPIAIALRLLSDAYWSRGMSKQALPYAKAGLAIAVTLGDQSELSTALSNIGNIYAKLSDHTLAIEYYEQALAIDRQLGNEDAIATTLGYIGQASTHLADYARAEEYLLASLAMFEEQGNESGTASTLHNIGSLYNIQVDFPRALEYFGRALAMNEKKDRKIWTGNNLGDIAAIYWKLLDYPRALEYYQQSLSYYELCGAKDGIITALSNIGAVYVTLTDYPLALEYLQRSLALAEEIGHTYLVAVNFHNIADVYQRNNDYARALEYYQKSLAISEKLGIKQLDGLNLANIGTLYAEKKIEGYDPALAEEYLLRAISVHQQYGGDTYLKDVYSALAALCRHEKRWEDADRYFQKYHELYLKIHSEEANAMIQKFTYDREAAERDKALAIAKAASDAKHQATEELLHNVLPPSIAHRILEGEKVIAEKLSNVSVLFADIVNFTKLSQRITPEELVEGLDRIFSTFDALAEKYGLEKIKTIGDAYMVVSGAPIQRDNHAEAMAQFALEMVEAMKEFRSISTGEEIQLRIGIHSGEVVAGVIGKKKFAYDLWGDAVNTASRMESHGEAGKIHVSEEFMRALPPTSQMFPMSPRFTERGEIDIKGKGLMKTYFLEKNP